MKVSGSYPIIAGLCLAFLIPLLIFAQPVRQVRLTRFALQSAAVIKAGGDSLSSVQYRSADYWFPVTVPSTVLSHSDLTFGYEHTIDTINVRVNESFAGFPFMVWTSIGSSASWSKSCVRSLIHPGSWCRKVTPSGTCVSRRPN